LKKLQSGYSRGVLVFFFALAISCNNKEVKTAIPTQRNSETVLYKMAIYGDSRTGHDIHRKIVKNIENENPDIVVHTGDMVNDGSIQAEWDNFNEITNTLRKGRELYTVIGNHEKDSPLFYSNFGKRETDKWFSVEKGNAVMIFIDTSFSAIDSSSDQFIWLSNILSQSEGKIKIVFSHYPIFSTGYHGTEKNLSDELPALFEKYKVSMYISGHEHDYERIEKNKVVYLIAGGGGAPLRGQFRSLPESKIFLKSYHYVILNIQESSIITDVYDENARLIDSF